MGKIFTGFMLGAGCLALLYLFIYTERSSQPTITYSVEPVAEPVTVPTIIDEARPYRPEATATYQAAPPRIEAPKLPEIGSGQPVKRGVYTEEIQEGMTTSGGRNK